MFEKPTPPKHTVIKKPDGLIIRVPTKRNILIFAVLSLWLCGWLFGEISVPLKFSDVLKEDPSAAAFMIVWFCAWTLGGAFAIYIWLLQWKGFEIITISPAALSIKRDILGFGRVRNYDRSQIRRFRLDPITGNPFDFRSGLAFWE